SCERHPPGARKREEFPAVFTFSTAVALLVFIRKAQKLLRPVSVRGPEVHADLPSQCGRTVGCPFGLAPHCWGIGTEYGYPARWGRVEKFANPASKRTWGVGTDSFPRTDRGNMNRIERAAAMNARCLFGPYSYRKRILCSRGD